MIDLELLIVVDGVKHHIHEVRPADFVALERHFKISVPELGGRISFDHMCFLAWRALRRVGVDVGEYEAFVDRIDTVEPIVDDAPFAPDDGPSPGS